MTEVLTESFCERCGTRYTFETVRQRPRPLSRVSTLGRGLRHFVVQSDASLDEAMAVARSEEEQRVTSAQLDAFHRTFNFCLSCRQYTCTECWNAVEGRCLSCAPMPVEATIVPAVAIAASMPIAVAPPAPITEPEPEPEVVAETLPEAQAEPEAPTEPGTHAEPEANVVPGPEAVVEPEPAVDGEPLSTAEPGAAAFPGFQPGRSLDDEIAAYELRIAALAAIPLDPGPPIMQAAEVAAPPLAPEPVVALASEGHETHAPLTSMPAPAVPAATTSPSAERPAVAAPGTCANCGLSLSASARFCRRCGTRQAA